jgi:hypothetical protein
MNLVGVNPQSDMRPGRNVVEPNPYHPRQKQGVNLSFPMQDLPGNGHGQAHHFRFHPLEIGFSFAGEFLNGLRQCLLLTCQLFLKVRPALC